MDAECSPLRVKHAISEVDMDAEYSPLRVKHAISEVFFDMDAECSFEF